jgi:hypothetical protein
MPKYQTKVTSNLLVARGSVMSASGPVKTKLVWVLVLEQCHMGVISELTKHSESEVLFFVGGAVVVALVVLLVGLRIMEDRGA